MLKSYNWDLVGWGCMYLNAPLLLAPLCGANNYNGDNLYFEVFSVLHLKQWKTTTSQSTSGEKAAISIPHTADNTAATILEHPNTSLPGRSVALAVE